MSYTRPVRNGANIPGDWWDSAFEKRIRISATNSSGSDLFDHLVSYTVPGGTTVDPGSMRVIEHTASGGVDRAYDWRYGVTSGSGNRLPLLPASISGGVVTFKALGWWPTGETRRFAVYWSAVNGQSTATYSHLDAIGGAWTATAVAGTAGDVYALVVGGTTYSYTMIGGDTATIIATALKTLINAGTVATATSSAGVLTILTTTPRTLTFTVANTGTTLPANLAVVKPSWFQIGRVGPDTESSGFAALSGFRVGLPNFVNNNPLTMGQTTGLEVMRLLHYAVNGDGGSYGIISATQSSITVSGPTLTVTGTLTGSIRSGQSLPDWTGTYTATYQNKICVLGKTDNTAPNTLNKQCDIVRLQVTLTCGVAHNPSTGSTSGTSLVNYDIFNLTDTNNLFTGGNTTTAAGVNRYQNYYYTSSTLTSFAGSANLSALPVNGLIVGSAGNSHAMALLVNSASFAGFTGQTTAALKWFANGNPFPYLQIVGLSAATTIPVGAQIAYDVTYAHSATANPTTTGDNMVAPEIVNVLQNVAYAPTVTTLATETFNASTLTQSMLLASSRAVAGAKWFQTNSFANTGMTKNYAYKYQIKTGTITTNDDDDGNYGVGHLAHGLCLRYLRTRDATLIPLIESYIQWFIDIEQAAITAYGSYWSGSAPYWYWPSSTASTGYTTEGGMAAGTFNLVDPGMPGGVKGTINYTRGQVRRLTSIDQMEMVGHALYAYLFLLRNDTAITANTTLQTNALAYLNRMKTFEADKFDASTCQFGNIYAICTGATPPNTGGSLSYANPYYGDFYGPWERSNVDGTAINASANSSVGQYFIGVYAPGVPRSDMINFMQGRCRDMLVCDFGRHDVVYGSNVAGMGVQGPYPPGCNVRAQTGNTTKYSAGRAGDTHYILCNDGGARDLMSGRAAQRMIVLAFTALLTPGFVLPTEEGVRAVPILTALDDLARILSLYGVEPTTGAQRFAIAAYLGKAGMFDPQAIDSTYTGYWLMATELWLLVQKAVTGTFDPATYYRFTTTANAAATQLLVGIQPRGAVHGTVFTQQPTVYAVDSNGYIDRTYTGNVTISIKSGTGTGGAVLGGTLTVACVNGVATFAGLSIDLAGSGYQLHATSGSLTAVDSVAFTVS